jgi:tripartite-type tricarboxylate transporter receptor subunit TctC
MNRSISFCVVVGLLAALAVLPAFAQKVDWPVRPVRLIVPFPPGGTTDPMARMVGARLNASLGQQFIVDNRPGASGSLGAAIAA